MVKAKQKTKLEKGITEAKLKQVDKVIKQYKSVPGSLILVLHKAQETCGYLPPSVQDRIADGLEISRHEVYGVVTFYSLFSIEPRGRHTIKVCFGTACYVKGANKIAAALSKELKVPEGATTPDMRFTFQVVYCLGACGRAPVMTANNDTFGMVDPQSAVETVKTYK
jgi:NADH:ubiquinone oxidoreductase subunit E